MATSGFTSDGSLWSRPHTPPYTPNRAKRPLSRASSFASIRSAVQADETASPAKKKATKRAVPDEVKVEELTEADIGYIADNEIVHPHELEEVDSSLSDNDDERDGSGDEEEEEDSGDGIVEQLSRLECEDEDDDPIAGFEKKRREKRERRRTNSRIFKRPHSLTVNVDTEVTDSEALPDHDLPESARRLRRRTRGPGDFGDYAYGGASGSAPSSGGLAPPAEIREGGHDENEEDNGNDSSAAAGPAANEAMDVDDHYD